jgi:hypothetical protein
VAGEVARLQQEIASHNMVEEGVDVPMDVKGMFCELGSLKLRLVDLKARIARGSAPVADKLAAMSEAKATLAFLKTIPCQPERHHNYGEGGDTFSKPVMDHSYVELARVTAQDLVNDLQDAINDHNAITKV